MEPQKTKRTVRPDAEAVKRLRLAKGWRVEDLATKAICSVKTIENIERGTSVYVTTLAKIAKALGVDFVTLVQGGKPLPERTDLALVDQPTAPIHPHPKVQITVDIPFGNFEGPQQLIDFVKHVKTIAQSTNDTLSKELTPSAIYQILLEYRCGKLDRYEAMDALDLDSTRELNKLCSLYKLPLELEAAPFQSDPSAPPVTEYFTEDD